MRLGPLLLALVAAGCAGRARVPPPPAAESAPSLRGATAMVFPVQNAAVPVHDAGVRRWPADRAQVDAEIAYWLQQGTPRTKWILPETIDRTLARSPMLNINPRSLAIGSFERAQVRRIGDPLFGDLARLAAILQARLAVLPIGAEFIGASADSAVLNIATAVIDATDGDVIWFGVIASSEKGVGSAAIASAAQAFARAFADKQPAGETRE